MVRVSFRYLDFASGIILHIPITLQSTCTQITHCTDTSTVVKNESLISKELANSFYFSATTTKYYTNTPSYQ